MVNISSLIHIDDKYVIDIPVENYNFNMSAVPVSDTEMTVAFRNSNVTPYTNAAGKYSSIYTGNLIDEHLSNLRKISYRGYGIPLWDRYNGMEDPRIFLWNGDLWCLFVRPNHRITRIFMVLLNLRNGDSIIMDDPQGRAYTKNWMPFVNGEQLFFVVDTSPFSLYELKDTKLNLVKKNYGVGYNVSGGSNIINIDDRLLAIVHGKEESDGKRYYWHAVANWDKNFDDMRIGTRFLFEKPGIEFCSSIAHHNGMIYIPYSVDDDGVSMLRISEKEFRKTYE